MLAEMLTGWKGRSFWHCIMGRLRFCSASNHKLDMYFFSISSSYFLFLCPWHQFQAFSDSILFRRNGRSSPISTNIRVKNLDGFYSMAWLIWKWNVKLLRDILNLESCRNILLSSNTGSIGRKLDALSLFFIIMFFPKEYTTLVYERLLGSSM